MLGAVQSKVMQHQEFMSSFTPAQCSNLYFLRDRLKATWVGEQGADSELLNEVKMLPIRIINSGAARALKHVPPMDRSLCF